MKNGISVKLVEFFLLFWFFFFFLASNRTFILFIVVLIYVYFMSEIEHILAAVHTDIYFTMNDCSLPIFLLSVYICVTIGIIFTNKRVICKL